MDVLPERVAVVRVLLLKKGAFDGKFFIFIASQFTVFTFYRGIKPTKWSVTKGDLGAFHPKFYHLSIF
jgi:hypothetical protein